VYVVAADTAPGAVSVVLANYGEAAVSVDVAGSGHTRYALERAPLALSGDPKVDGRYSVDDGAYVPDGDADLLFEGFITTTTGDVSATGVRIDLDAWETVMLELTSG